MTLNIPRLLRQHGIRPQKKLGQNFLVDEYHLKAIVDAAGIGPSDTVLDIGAGLGSLTLCIAERAQRVIAVEMDKALFPILESNLSEHSNVEFVLGDILALDLNEIISEENYQVVANIPYYLTSKLIKTLLEAKTKASGITLTVQKEMAERACAQVPNMSLLALSVQMYGEAKIKHHIPAGAFYPVPQVDSAVLKIDIFEKARVDLVQREYLFSLAKTAFQQKRKMLANSLATYSNWGKELAIERLEKIGIDPRRRPETISLEEWVLITEIDQAQ